MTAGCRCCGGVGTAPTCELQSSQRLLTPPPHCGLPAPLLPEGCKQAAGLGTYRRTCEEGGGRSLARQSRASLLTSWWRVHEGN